MGTAIENIISAIEISTGKTAHRSGDNYRLPCPAHGGEDHNLSLSDGTDRVLMHCHSHGCDPKDILESIGMNIKDVYFEQLSPEQSKKHAIQSSKIQILNSLLSEVQILALWLNDALKGKESSTEDKARVGVAFSRIVNGIAYLESRV